MFRGRASWPFAVWAGGLAAAACLQGTSARRFARATAWPHSHGWQREIALWNVGMLATLLAVQRSEAGASRVWPGLAVLSTGLGINHLTAAVRTPNAPGHWLGTVANLAGVFAAIQAQARKPSTTDGNDT